MKKTISIVLSFLILLSMSIPALAVQNVSPTSNELISQNEFSKPSTVKQLEQFLLQSNTSISQCMDSKIQRLEDEKAQMSNPSDISKM